MHSASELADWWDKKTKESDKALLEFVDEHPKLWVIAAVAQTGMEFAGVMVFDVLRFGEGAAESYETGKVAPLVQDVFRGMSIVAPAAKLARAGAPAVAKGLGKVVPLYAGGKGPCVPIAVGNALRRTGQRFFLSLTDIAKAHGFESLADLAKGTDMQTTIQAFRKLGVAFQELGRAMSLESLATRLLGKNGVIMIRIVSSDGKFAHRILLEQSGGGVRIIDRYGTFANLEAMTARYRNLLGNAKWIVDAEEVAVLVKGVTTSFLNGMPTLMIPASAIVQLGQGTTLPQLDAQFQQFQARGGSNGSNVIHLTPPPRVVVARGDTLSGLAAKHYGSMEYWPLLWDANKETIGANPNRISPGMTLKVPALSAFGEKEKADARRRHPTWKSYR